MAVLQSQMKIARLIISNSLPALVLPADRNWFLALTVDTQMSRRISLRRSELGMPMIWQYMKIMVVLTN